MGRWGASFIASLNHALTDGDSLALIQIHRGRIEKSMAERAIFFFPADEQHRAEVDSPINDSARSTPEAGR